jgi:hypothetical protein
LTYIRKKIITLSALCLFCLYALTSAEAQTGSAAEKYKEVDRLMQIFDYNGAINLLVDIVKDNPDEMEKAQKKIQEIRQRKEQFNERYAELIRVLFEENDYEKGLQIISELEALDANPNTATTESLVDARISAELIYFRLLFNDLMDRALVQIEEGNYREAVSIYSTGFQLHRRTFDERNYGPIVKAPVEDELAELNAAMEAFQKDYGRLGDYSAFSLSSSVNENNAQQPGLLEDLGSFTRLRNAIWQAGYVFERQNELLGRISSEYREDFFLSFANRIVFGRLDRRHEEGLIEAMDRYWESALIPLEESLRSRPETLMARGEQAFDREDWPLAQQNFDEAEFWADRTLELSRMWSGRINLDDGLSLYPDSSAVLRREYPHLVNARIQKDKAAYLSRLSLIYERLTAYREYDSDNLEEMRERRDTLAGELAAIVPISEEWERDNRKYRSDILYTDGFAQEQNSYVSARLEKGIGDYRTLDGRIALDSADYEILPLEAEYNAMRDSVADALARLEGIPPEGADPDDRTVLYVYPEDSFAIIEGLLEDNAELSRLSSRYKEFYQEVRRTIPQKEEMSAYIGRAEALILNMEDDLLEYSRIQRRSDQNIAQAERFFGEGNFRFGQAENALNRKDFAQATQQLSSSQELYVQALSYNEEVLSREDLDRRISDLQARILQEENKEVIRYVRENVNRGKSLYLQGLYAQSEVVLLRAESRWFTTNTDPNSEINYWLNLVRAALSVESGRTIEETEPLYKEMTQFLNHALSNFEAGSNAMARGEEALAYSLLDKADQNLNEILIPMPLNQQASVLKLRIQQLRDPDEFEITFEEKFKSAVSRLRTDPDESYIDLKDLAAIQPDYPGIRKAIYDAEIILGIRRPPPDLRAQAESEDLYDKAYAIVQGNVRSQFPVALKQLDRAIELNPENQDAIELKDRIQLDAGGQTAIVLSSSDNARFKAAEEKYINGEYFEAYAIVQQLLNDKKTASYPPLQDLKRRIESKF